MGDFDPFTGAVYDAEGNVKFRNVSAMLNFNELQGEEHIERGRRTVTLCYLINLLNLVAQIVLRVSLRHENALKTNGDTPIHVLYNVSPTRIKERLC